MRDLPQSGSPASQGCSTELRYNNIEKKKNDDNGYGESLGVLPPHLSPGSPCTAPEGRCLVRHIVGFVDQELDAFTPTKDLFDILDHDIFDLIEFGLGTCDLVLRGRGIVRVHEGGYDG